MKYIFGKIKNMGQTFLHGEYFMPTAAAIMLGTAILGGSIAVMLETPRNPNHGINNHPYRAVVCNPDAAQLYQHGSPFRTLCRYDEKTGATRIIENTLTTSRQLIDDDSDGHIDAVHFTVGSRGMANGFLPPTERDDEVYGSLTISNPRRRNDR